VSLVGDSSRSLGQVFTEPPKNIGNGDGFAPQPLIDGDGNAAVMVVAHHSRGLNIGALDLVTTSRITPLVLGGSELTANGFGYVQDPLTKRIYVPTDTNGQFTYSCINGDFRISLGETPSLCTSVKPNAGWPGHLRQFDLRRFGHLKSFDSIDMRRSQQQQLQWLSNHFGH